MEFMHRCSEPKICSHLIHSRTGKEQKIFQPGRCLAAPASPNMAAGTRNSQLPKVLLLQGAFVSSAPLEVLMLVTRGELIQNILTGPRSFKCKRAGNRFVTTWNAPSFPKLQVTNLQRSRAKGSFVEAVVIRKTRVLQISWSRKSHPTPHCNYAKTIKLWIQTKVCYPK